MFSLFARAALLFTVATTTLTLASPIDATVGEVAHANLMANAASIMEAETNSNSTSNAALLRFNAPLAGLATMAAGGVVLAIL
ncbi:hypothetical protein FISHEDRAFT_75906 [Fistulina hepatica ATCC 64428]|uniref:Uncharacterized protein n=1 Tax=Fistulina hepatica ATCC 64428 TaxID=1128425 RepID=A0A0D7A5R1_9AGAR|nr:hypothetical protein FISHEDRAFT_75906 [Fistulina hepatica ATCC 64428]